MPSVSSCLLHVFGFAEYPYQTESKWDKNGRSLFFENMENSEGKSTRTSARGGHEAGRPPTLVTTVRRLTLFFCRKKANIQKKKITAKVSGQSELRISIYTRNGETEPGENAETERDGETDPITEGLSPLPRHGGQGPEGKPFSHLGRRSRKKRKKGPLSPSPPVAPQRRRGHHHHHHDLHQHLRHLYQCRCTRVGVP